MRFQFSTIGVFNTFQDRLFFIVGNYVPPVVSILFFESSNLIEYRIVIDQRQPLNKLELALL